MATRQGGEDEETMTGADLQVQVRDQDIVIRHVRSQLVFGNGGAIRRYGVSDDKR